MEEFVVGLGFCPWAGPADAAGMVRVVSTTATCPQDAFADLRAEAAQLEARGEEGTPQPGEAITTLLVCPNVDEWREAGAFRQYYEQELADGYAFARQELYVVAFHPRYEEPGPVFNTGDRIELGQGPDGAPVLGTVLDAHVGFSDTGERLAKVRVEDESSEECLICLPPAGAGGGCEAAALASRAPRPVLHLLRVCDLSKAEDDGLRERNRRSAERLGPQGVAEILRRCG